MRKIMIAGAVLLSGTAYADSNDGGVCKSIAKLSETVMKFRQAGKPMHEMMSIVDNETGQKIIIAAYEKTRYHTEGRQQRQIEDFRDGMYLACIKDRGTDF